MQKMSKLCFVDLAKAYHRVAREKLWKVMLQDSYVDGRLLLVIKSVYSCVEVCIRVGVVNRQGCVLFSRLFIV